MASLTDRLLVLLPAYGPWLLFSLAFLETSFLTGLVVPAGLATAMGAALALEDTLTFPSVVGAVVAGGTLGDSVGYWVGRVVGDRMLHGESRWGHLLQRRELLLARWFGRHPAYSVTLARVVSFVRTVMPVAAGVSRLRYTRFVAYDLAGVALCAAMYVAMGVLAQESLEAVAQLVGLGGALAFAGAFMGAWWTVRRRVARRGRRRTRGDDSAGGGGGEGLPGGERS